MSINSRILLVVGLLLGLCAVKLLFGYFAPFLLGIMIATLMDPAVDFCEQKGCPRQVASLLVMLIVFGSLLFLIAIAIAGLWYEFDQLVDLAQLYYSGQIQSVDKINQMINRMPDQIQTLIPAVLNSVGQFVISMLGELLSLIKKVPAFLLSWMIAGMTAFFISRDKKAIVRFIVDQLPSSWHKKFFGLKHTLLQSVFAYIKAQLVLMWVSMCIAVSGFLLVDHPYAWVLGIFAGFLDLIPMVGPTGIFIPVIVYNLAVGLVRRSIFIAAVWLILLLVRQMSEPPLVGGEIGLHPLSTMAGIYIGAKLMGFTGVFLGPMAVIFCKAVYLIVNDTS